MNIKALILLDKFAIENFVKKVKILLVRFTRASGFEMKHINLAK